MSDNDIKKPNVEHLQMIEGVIDRLAQNSTNMKNWFLAIASALLGFGSANGNSKLGWIALVSGVVFWGLDAFYLMLERRYRRLYADVANSKADIPPFSMQTNKYKTGRETLWSSIRSCSTLWFYFPIILGIAMITNLGLLITNDNLAGDDKVYQTPQSSIHVDNVVVDQRCSCCCE